MLAFTTEIIDDAPDADERRQALARATAMALPTAEQEVWRYSRIGELNLADFRVASATTTVTNGDHGATSASSPGEPAGEPVVHDIFDELSAAFGVSTHLVIPDNVVVADPIVVTHTIDDDGVIVFPRLAVTVGVNAQVTVVERFESPDAVRSVVVPRLVVAAGAGTNVNYVAVNMLGSSTWQLGHQQAVGERDSTTRLATIAIGGDYARVRTDARVVAPGARTQQVAVYFADGHQMHDFRTLQDHIAPRTSSDLLFKGAVRDVAKSVYTGLIRIGEDAKGSVAYQTNRSLTLSEGAWAESVPNLDIRTNDVKCSHASTVGPIDDGQRFYLESRGIPPEVAERLVVLGFFDEVLEQLPLGTLAAELRQAIAAKLSAVPVGELVGVAAGGAQ